jgi:hypothetical protein
MTIGGLISALHRHEMGINTPFTWVGPVYCGGAVQIICSMRKTCAIYINTLKKKNIKKRKKRKERFHEFAFA